MSRILALVWHELRLPEADARPFERMLDALDDLSPRVEAVDLGVALVDVTGLEPMWGPEQRIAARAVMLVRAVAPLHVRCGIGDNRWLATLAARLTQPTRPDAPAALRVLARDELPDLPLTLLPADAATRQRFTLFGLTRMQQLAELPRSAVGAQFGAAGERLQALARGHDPRPIVPRPRPERVEADATFEPPIDGVGAVGLTLRRLAAELCDRLRERHLAPGRATLVLRFEDAPALRVAQPFPQPALEPDWIARLLLSRVEAAARLRTSRAAAVPRTNQSGLSQRKRPQGLIPATHNLGKPMTLNRSSSVNPGGPSPKAATVGTWQEQGPPEDAEEEPRVASVRLAFDRLADPATRQLPAFEVQAGRWEELRWSIERIRHRFGEGRLWRAVIDRPMAALPEHRSRLAELNE
jgi:nucleotidyltransferase/DNA polymerase involved in DNA repair